MILLEGVINIFVLDNDPVIAAQSQCDKHVVKMALETAQLLCTAIIETGGVALYKSAYKNHPCAVWARQTKSNFDWLRQHGIALCNEYTYRYGGVHKCEAVINSLSSLTIPDGSLTPFPLTMPEHCFKDDVVASYREYYCKEKAAFAKWTRRMPPDWFPNAVFINERKDSKRIKNAQRSTMIRKRNNAE